MTMPSERTRALIPELQYRLTVLANHDRPRVADPEPLIGKG